MSGTTATKEGRSTLVPEIKKLRLVNRQAPGDVLMLTAAIRDLHLSYPGRFLTDVSTPFPELWESNPYVISLPADERDVYELEMHYPLINNSNEGALHFIHGFRTFLEENLGISIKPTKLRGDLYLSAHELRWASQVHEHFTGWDTPYWLICTGGKLDYTAKWWIPEFAQSVVDYFRNKIQFVQFGAVDLGHYHPILKGVINLVGHTDLRQLIRLIYHAAGIICPVTFAMHAAAAVPAKPGFPMNKLCIVTAGGREPSIWEAYNNHAFLHCCGQLYCCDRGACWRSRTFKLDDGDINDDNICNNTVQFNGRQVQRCMRDFVTADDVIRTIERYYGGGLLNYLPAGYQTIHAEWSERMVRRANISPNQDALMPSVRVAIIASGAIYRRAAALAAATYTINAMNAAVTVYLPVGEQDPFVLSMSSLLGFSVRSFLFKQVNDSKFTTQLKCQGFSTAFETYAGDDLLLFVDADTCCRRPLQFEPELINKIKQGRIGLVPDLSDRHENRTDVPWYIPSEKRERYVNSGIILTSKVSLDFFSTLLSLSREDRFLAGPFNDQNVINYALAQHYPGRLLLLDTKYNGMEGYRNEQSLITHHSGGAGNMGTSLRAKGHFADCMRIIQQARPEAFARISALLNADTK